MNIRPGSFCFLISLWVLTGCTFGRVLLFQLSDIHDDRKFPSRAIHKGPTTFTFTDPGREWKMSHPVSVTTPDRRFRKLDDFLPETPTVAFLIVRHDSILYEYYPERYDSVTPVPSFSVAKSFVSALTGIAIAEGKIRSTEDSMTHYLTELRGKGLESVKLRHLLQMTSGLHSVESYYLPFSGVARLYYGTHIRRQIRKVTAENPPGISFANRSLNTQLLAMTVERATGTTLSQYLQEKIWEPLGMESDASWSIDQKKEGMEKAFCCLNATARDFAKFGRLYLNRGNWNGKQIIPESWVEESTRVDAREGANWKYQFQWWIPSHDGDFSARGLHGEYIYVNPSRQLVIVRLGKQEGDVNWIQVFREIAGVKEVEMRN